MALPHGLRVRFGNYPKLTGRTGEPTSPLHRTRPCEDYTYVHFDRPLTRTPTPLCVRGVWVQFLPIQGGWYRTTDLYVLPGQELLAG